jgi:hypothetical protein
MKRTGKECFCNSCLENLINIVIIKKCKICDYEFVASVFGFKLKRMEIPENCAECRLANGNKLRQVKEMDFLNQNKNAKDEKLIQVDNSLNISREENEFSNNLL